MQLLLQWRQILLHSFLMINTMGNTCLRCCKKLQLVMTNTETIFTLIGVYYHK